MPNYEIDRLNPEDKKSIGYMRTEVLDPKTGGCSDPAPDTTGDSPEPRSKYRQCNKATPVPGEDQDTPTPDVEGTKNIMMQKEMNKTRVSDVLKNTWNSLTGADRATHKVLFDRAGEALDGVKWSRYIGYFKYVVDHLGADKPEIKVVAPEAGKDWQGNPVYDFQLQETIKANEEKHPDVRDQLEASLGA
ncbi:hypothetical protein F5Y01DRAFT_313003 [Xylaria sp. FL0043]|nr:hypothetical protein F5Y01DRAFT_313003 [Xylaria sp. FL0043]